MGKINRLPLLLIFFTFPFFSGCSRESPGGLKIYVSITPQKYFLDRIGGGELDVIVMVPTGKNPASYEPTPRQVAGLADAVLYFTAGVPFEEAFLPVISSEMKNLKIIDTSRGIEKVPIDEHRHGDDASGGEAADEVEGGPDPHVWMDPLLALEMAKTMAEALTEVDPGRKESYSSGLALFRGEMEDLNTELEGILKPYSGTLFFVYHPAFGYFARRYGLRQVAVETGGKEPTPAGLQAIIAEALEMHVSTIFVQPEFPAAAAEKAAAAAAAEVVQVSPLEYDYPAMLRRIAFAFGAGGTRMETVTE